MKPFLKKNIFPLLIIFISIILFITNYKPGTLLIGWDNLFPEFNPLLNIKRDLFAVWQQYRGLGALDNFAHSSNLIHDLFRFFLSLFLPLDRVRWVFMSLMQAVGGFGLYYLVTYLLSKEHKENIAVKLAAFIAALFYQYNIGTIQQFFLPLEVFVIHFAFLPWLFLASLLFFHTGSKKNLILFATISLISTPQAFIPTVFAVYFLGIILFFSSHIILKKFDRESVKRVIILILTIFITNAFWILPTTWSFITYRKTVSSAKNYQMASNDLYYRNRKYGDFQNVALIKGVPLEYQSMDFKLNTNVFMMRTWLEHMSRPIFYIPAWIFFIVAVIGFIMAVKKRTAFIPIAAIFFFSFFLMGTEIPIFGTVFSLWRNYLPIVSTIFRFVFTKFSILYAFSYSILLAVGIYHLLQLFHDRTKVVMGIVLFFLIILYTFPAFRGHFYYENLGVKIPQEYFQTFTFFSAQPSNERVASLPVLWYWAWAQPSWGTINSGFLWYGIEQPINDLAFIPWGRENENFYWELDRAVYSKNPILLENVLKKYDISWVYFDKNIYNDPGRKMTYDMYEALLQQVEGLELTRTFGKINIYHFKSDRPLNNFVSIKSNLPVVSPNVMYDDFDSAYINEDDYIYDNKNVNVYYPYRTLFSGKSPSDIEYTIKEDIKDIVFIAKIPLSLTNKLLKIPEISDEEFSIFRNYSEILPYSVQLTIDNLVLLDKDDFLKQSENTLAFPEFSKGNMELRIDKRNILEYTTYTDEKYLGQKNDTCNVNVRGIAKIERVNSGFKLTSIHSNNCIKIELPQLSHRYGYLFVIQSVSDTERGLHLNLFNTTVGKSDVETYLTNDGRDHYDYLINPPRNQYGMGYTLYVNNISEGQEKVVNTLESVKVYKIPYLFLKNLKIYGSNLIENKNRVQLPINKVKHSNPYSYLITINNSSSDQELTDNILYLSQSFSPGWKAWVNGTELKNHVLVNNWANAWRLEESPDFRSKTLDVRNENKSLKSNNLKSIVIIFWPQYLEFIGFGLLIATFIFVIQYRHEEE